MDTNQAEKNVELHVFMASAKAGYDASGVFDGSGIMIHKGSVLSIDVTSDRLDAHQRVAAITPAGILKEDTYFDSPSAAAVFVCGRSANGWVEWKDSNGKKLQEYRGVAQTQSTAVSALASRLSSISANPTPRTTTNMVGPEGDEVTIEIDALAEERSYAEANYRHLQEEYAQIEAKLPYPDVKPYDTTWFPDDLSALRFKKEQNQPYWVQMNAVREYTETGDLYSGHIRFNAGGDRFFMEAPGLKTKEWVINGHRVMLIHVDDKHYKPEIDAWHYPDQNMAVAFSRNIMMQNKKVQAVDIVLDRSDSMYASITDNYLRNALKRNKNKVGFQSIIQTIQKKQDDIRSLDKNRSFIVQGCAGSGKTMVLLHRLRYLIYNKDIYSEDYYFLVPSVAFKKYIKDVAAKFNISYGNVLSYQGYYRFILGKADSELSDETSELVFPAEYLSRVYSKEFMQECYSSLFDLIIEQTNGLNEFCDEKLNELIVVEEERVAKAIDAIRNKTISAVIKCASHISKHLEIEVDDYDHVATLIVAMRELVDNQKALIGNVSIDEKDITIAPDDPRIVTDDKLQALIADVEAEAVRIKKASIFTVNSHRKKHQQLVARHDAYREELLARIIAEEVVRRKEEAEKLSLVFGNVTIRDLEATLEEVVSIYETAHRELCIETDKQEHIMDVIANKHSDAIQALTRMIEASADIEESIVNWVNDLQPATSALQEYLRYGTELYSAFIKFTSDKKDQEAFREKYKIFARRTDKEQLAYFNTLLMNICRKKIKDEFNVKISDVYKHYWYIALYCNYLINGNTSKAKPYIYIDEAQDLSVAELELIQKLNNKPVMNLFGDINQVITAHGIRNWNAVPGEMEVLCLDENFRNTNQIVDYCNRELPFQMKKIGVDMEEVRAFDSVNNVLAQIRVPDHATFIVKDEAAADDLTTVLRTTAIRGYRIYTVKEAKGLEFKWVFVVDRDMSINEKYISYTRALAKLTVMHDLPRISDPDAKRIVEGEDLESA